jgi:hypothetical protein
MSELTTVEVSRLEHLESLINKGMKAFLEVGSALSEIQSSRLYRAQYLTFEEYCQTRWGFTASRGRQLIHAVEAIASLPEDLPQPSNAAQASALADIDEEDRAEAWQSALEEADVEDREVTARDIREAGERIRQAAPIDEKSMGESNIDEIKQLFKDLLAGLDSCTEMAQRLSKTSAEAWLLTSGSALLKHIRDARDHVSAARPAAVCPECGGDGCRKCHQTGWVNKARLNSLKPSR